MTPIKTILELEAAAGKVHALTCEYNDIPPGAQDALRGAADAINGIASLLRDANERAEDKP